MKKIKQTRQATAIGLIIAVGLVGCKSETHTTCLWSDTRQAVPLEDKKAAYYGFRVIESRSMG